VKGAEDVEMRTRFAPAPTGHLHLGHVHNAIHVWEFAQAHNGTVLLRIEDHDRQRARPEFEVSIRKDLEWLGFHPHEEAARQSERDEVYRAVITDLAARGLVFGCDCSRQDIAAVGEDARTELRYRGTCRTRGLGLAEGRGWRVRIEPGIEHFVDGIQGAAVQDPFHQCGDVLVRDRLGNWTYQFAVAVDDYLQNISHVIRGMDLFASTGRQIRLARLAGRAEPASFRHHGLIMRTPTQKLSKSDGDTGVHELRKRGWTAEAVIELARWPVGASQK
jgi:glutamyl-tRNA synthetase/glutamyl-Q tRNA(Asp) synthetase